MYNPLFGKDMRRQGDRAKSGEVEGREKRRREEIKMERSGNQKYAENDLQSPSQQYQPSGQTRRV